MKKVPHLFCFSLALTFATAFQVNAQTTLPALPVRSNAQAPLAAAQIAQQSPLAKAILNGWQGVDPERGHRVVHVVYWTPADREPAPRYRERLSKIVTDIQGWYAGEMARNGFGPETFQLEKEADGLLKITVVRGSKPRVKYSGDDGDEIRADALKQSGIDGEHETTLLFCNLGDWDAATRTITGSSPYYAYGTTRMGTAWQSDSPILDLDGLTDVSEAHKVHSGQYGFITLGHYDSIFIGGIAHELGHALSMPHNIEAPIAAGWGKSLMGSGNRTYGEELRGDAKTESQGHGSFLPFADALRLASHPSFCGSIKGIKDASDAVFSDVSLTTDGKTITYSAKVMGSVPIYGVIGYMDPTGGQDYDATTTTAIPDQDGHFTLKCDALVAGKGGSLHVVALQANGAATSAAAGTGSSPLYPYNVAQDGTVDLKAWDTQQQVKPLVMAIGAGDRAGIARAAAALKAIGADPQIIEAAAVQAQALAFKFGPEPTDATGNTLFLSGAKPTSATVGWMQPTYDRLPAGDAGNGPLLQAGDRYFARGIYAHAPASHVYNLGGKWSKLTGTAGLAQSASPSVVFVISGDGKELWSSPLMKDFGALDFNLDVTGVKSLELKVEDGGNGNSSDWGLWLNPTLTR